MPAIVLHIRRLKVQSGIEALKQLERGKGREKEGEEREWDRERQREAEKDTRERETLRKIAILSCVFLAILAQTV